MPKKKAAEEQTEPVEPSGHIPEPPKDEIPPEEDYKSNSSIDNEPREPGEKKQVEIFDHKAHEAKVAEHFENHAPQYVDYQLTIMLKGNTFSNTIKFGCDGVPTDQFLELLTKKIHGDYFKQQIVGVCGVQRDELPKQEELFDSNPLTKEAGIVDHVESVSVLADVANALNAEPTNEEVLDATEGNPEEEDPSKPF